MSREQKDEIDRLQAEAEEQLDQARHAIADALCLSVEMAAILILAQ